MDEPIKKICPICEMEIEEGEAITTCPDCQTTYHAACWEYAGGCVSVECKRQSEEEKTEDKIRFCANCGSEINEGQTFCANCGYKASENPAVQTTTQETQNQAEQKKKHFVKIAVLAGIALFFVIFACVFLPKLFVSVDDLCARGEYVKAYEKAKGDEKIAVKAESIAAECSAKTSDSMKNPASFELRRAYYKEGLNDDGTPNAQLVLEVLGTNSYGGKVTNYWLYKWDSVKKWELWDSYSDLSEEEYSKYDTNSEMLEKLYGNLGKIAVKNTVSNGTELKKEAIKRINNLFKEDKLDGVESINLR